MAKRNTPHLVTKVLKNEIKRKKIRIQEREMLREREKDRGRERERVRERE